MAEPNLQLEQLRSPEVRDRILDGWTSVVFACGAVEQHGPHLPLFVDAEHGTCLASEVAVRLGNTMVAPTIRVGCSEHHMSFAGTLTLRRKTFEALVTDYVSSLSRHGFERIGIIPTHGGNFKPLQEMADQLREAAGAATVKAYTDLLRFINLWKREAQAVAGQGHRVGGHADLAETSIMLHLHSDLVRPDLAEAGFQAPLTDQVISKIIRDGFDSVTQSGILGDARGATADLGQRLIERLATEVADFFRAEEPGS